MTEIGELYRSNGIVYKVTEIDGGKVTLKDIEHGIKVEGIDGLLHVSGFRPVRQTVRAPRTKVLTVDDDGNDVWR